MDLMEHYAMIESTKERKLSVIKRIAKEHDFAYLYKRKGHWIFVTSNDGGAAQREREFLSALPS